MASFTPVVRKFQNFEFYRQNIDIQKEGTTAIRKLSHKNQQNSHLNNFSIPKDAVKNIHSQLKDMLLKQHIQGQPIFKLL